MVAVLFLVGEGKERPEIVTELLDLQATPRRPNYEMASDVSARAEPRQESDRWCDEARACGAYSSQPARRPA